MVCSHSRNIVLQLVPVEATVIVPLGALKGEHQSRRLSSLMRMQQKPTNPVYLVRFLNVSFFIWQTN